MPRDKRKILFNKNHIKRIENNIGKPKELGKQKEIDSYDPFLDPMVYGPELESEEIAEDLENKFSQEIETELKQQRLNKLGW